MVLRSKTLSKQTERTNHRNAEVIMEVGLADSTQSLGKPSTRGSGKAKFNLLKSNIITHGG